MNFTIKERQKTTKFIAIIVLLWTWGLHENNFIDTGICNGRFDGSLLEYLEAPAILIIGFTAHGVSCG
ncbi:MAG: hypothetical protein ACLUDU_01205 [Butyricimonas faecihominis]